MAQKIFFTGNSRICASNDVSSRTDSLELPYKLRVDLLFFSEKLRILKTHGFIKLKLLFRLWQGNKMCFKDMLGAGVVAQMVKLLFQCQCRIPELES